MTGRGAVVTLYRPSVRLAYYRYGMSDEDRYVAPARDVHMRVAQGVLQIVVCVVLLTAFEVGEFWWWWGLVSLPLTALYLCYWLVDLYRHRHERAKVRAERWDPWG